MYHSLVRSARLARAFRRGAPTVLAMRDYLLFYLNGRHCRIAGETAFASLAEFLRRVGV